MSRGIKLSLGPSFFFSQNEIAWWKSMWRGEVFMETKTQLMTDLY